MALSVCSAIGCVQKVFDWAETPQQEILIELLCRYIDNVTTSVLGFSVLASVIRYRSAPMNSLTLVGIKQLACKR